MNDVIVRIDAMLKKVIKTQKQITPEKTLGDDLGLTSLQLMELLGMIEDEYDITVPASRAMYIKTVADLYREVENFIKEARKAS